MEPCLTRDVQTVLANNPNPTRELCSHTSDNMKNKDGMNVFTKVRVNLVEVILIISPSSLLKRRSFGFQFAFPFKVHAMLDEVDKEGCQDIVSWQPHGMAFRIHKLQEFSSVIMPKFFTKAKYRSFQRQLHIYGFNRIKSKASPDFGAYYHELFHRGKSQLCLNMTRVKIKGNKSIQERVPIKDPDFYADFISAPLPEKPTSFQTTVNGSSHALASGMFQDLPPDPTLSSNNSYGASPDWLSLARKYIAANQQEQPPQILPPQVSVNAHTRLQNVMEPAAGLGDPESAMAQQLVSGQQSERRSWGYPNQVQNQLFQFQIAREHQLQDELCFSARRNSLAMFGDGNAFVNFERRNSLAMDGGFTAARGGSLATPFDEGEELDFLGKRFHFTESYQKPETNT